ncbi:MAG: GntR family transcriptional regulator [Sphingomicrobium sp.]
MSKASELAYRHIRGAILEGALAPGEQLREEQLAEACGVSRTPVREALRRLETEHYVRRTDSQRTFVTDWSIDEIEEAFALRGMLEGHAAARASCRIVADDIDRLGFHNQLIKAAANERPIDSAAFLEHNREFHAIVLQAAGSARLTGLLGTIIEQPIVLRTARRYDRDQVLRSFAEHEELILAFRRQDPAWAEAVMKAHIRRAFHAYRDAFQNALVGDQIGKAAE